jgi:hypothetical protein
MWQYKQETYLVIAIGEANEDLDHDVVVKEFTQQGQIKSLGIGVYREGQREVRIPLISQSDLDGVSGYWFQLSWVADHEFGVNQKKKKNCRSTKNRYLAVKTRDFYNGMEDSKAPTIMKKMTKAR